MVSTLAADVVWHRLNDDFPFVTRCVYLNTAAAGVSWSGQGQAAAAFYDDAKSLGFNGMARWRGMAARARASIARLVGCSESEIRFVGSTTEGLNLIVSSMAWRSGDEIVFADDEFPSVVAACERAVSAGVTARRVHISKEREREAALAAAITSATRMVAVSHVHWATGTRIDVARLASLCDAVGATLLVDGVQALGAAPVTLGSAHAYCASVFKWLLSGFGLAVLIVREPLQRQLAPVARGYNNPAPATELQYSHINYPGICALAAARLRRAGVRLAARLRPRRVVDGRADHRTRGRGSVCGHATTGARRHRELRRCPPGRYARCACCSCDLRGIARGLSPRFPAFL